jgi:hypothetical protein
MPDAGRIPGASCLFSLTLTSGRSAKEGWQGSSSRPSPAGEACVPAKKANPIRNGALPISVGHLAPPASRQTRIAHSAAPRATTDRTVMTKAPITLSQRTERLQLLVKPQAKAVGEERDAAARIRLARTRRASLAPRTHRGTQGRTGKLLYEGGDRIRCSGTKSRPYHHAKRALASALDDNRHAPRLILTEACRTFELIFCLAGKANGTLFRSVLFLFTQMGRVTQKARSWPPTCRL